MAASEAFRFIQPYCVRVAKSPSVENICELQNALAAGLETTALQEKSMLEYIIFPLKLTIQRTKHSSENIIIKTLCCMTFILDLVVLENEDLYNDIFDTCCRLLSSKKHASGAEMLEKSSDELKSSIVDLLSTLLTKADKDIFCSLYTNKNLPRLGHAVSLLLAVCEFEKEKILRTKAVECLQQLAGKDKRLSSPQCKKSSEVFCSFIPGISLSLSRIIQNDPKIGQKLSIAIIKAWQIFLIVVMKDTNFTFLCKDVVDENLSQRMTELKSNLKNDGIEVLPVKSVERQYLLVNKDKEWLNNTQSKIKIILEKFLPFVAHSENLKIRMTCVSFIKEIMKNCAKSMEACLPTSIEVLAGLLQDDYEEVSKAALNALQLGQTVFEHGNSSLNTVIEESLYERLLSLPRVMRGANEKQKLAVLNAILGYINLLGNQISKVFNSLTMLEKIIKAFVQALELNVQDIKIVEEKSQMTSQDFVNPGAIPTQTDKDIFEQRFKNFNDVRILKTIKKICHAIGKLSDLQIVVDYQIEVIQSSTLYRKEAILLLNEILLGRADFEKEKRTMYLNKENTSLQPTQSQDVLSSIIQQVISTYLRDEFWYLPTSNITRFNSAQKQLLSEQLELIKLESQSLPDYWEKGISFEQLNSNIQLICLLMEGIAVCSTALKEDFKVFLINVLYPLLEKHGNENAEIARAAHSTLVTISKNCNENSVADLITHNADYIINAISMSFRHLTLFSSAPCVLSVILAYCDADILPLLGDVIDDVFYSLDSYQDDIAFSLMKVLQSLTSSVKEWFADKEAEDDPKNGAHPNKKVLHTSSPTELRDFLSEYCKLRLEALGEVDEESADPEEGAEMVDQNEAEVEKDEKKKTIPCHFQAVITTLEKCQHFLPANDMSLKMLVLDVIELGVQALRRRKDDLLPAIHKLWPSIVRRLKDHQPVVITRTLEVVCVMINCSEDFMRQRICKDFLPVAIDYLGKQLKKSHKSNSMYKFSHSCKLQAKLIDVVGCMVMRLEFADSDLAIAASCCSGYLDCRQPQLLQNAAVNALQKMKTIDSDYIWFLLVTLYSPSELKPETSSFKDITLLPKSVVKNEFSDNVVKILK